MRHGVFRMVAALLAFACSALSFELPRTPAVIRFNLHPFVRRQYGKVIAGGRGVLDTIRGLFRGALLALGSVGRCLVPALFAGLLLIATLLALNGPVGDGALLAAGAVAFSSTSLRDAKRALVAKSRSVLEDAQKAEQAVEERAGATKEEKEQARANTERAKRDARALLEQAEDLDEDIKLAEQQEAQEAALGRSQGRRAGGADMERASLQGGDSPERGNAHLFEGGPLSSMIEGSDTRKAAAEHRSLVAARMLRALAAARGDVPRAIDHARRHWGEDDLAFRALQTAEDQSGGALVYDALAEAVIEFLRPRSVVRSLNPTVIQTGTGGMLLPKLAGGAAAEYIGEGDNAPKTEATFGRIRAVFKKLAALVPISNDLLRNAQSSVDTLVRDDTTAAMGQRSDLAFIRGLGTEHSPKGLRHWVPAANVINADNTGALADVTSDLDKLALALEESNVRMLRPAWLFAPRTKRFLMSLRDGNGNFAFRAEMLNGTLLGWPFGSTTQIPRNLGGGGNESEVYLVDMADAVIVEALAMMVDASKEAAYHDGSTVQAAFSRDETVLRAIQEHDFVMRHAESIAVLPDVTWGA